MHNSTTFYADSCEHFFFGVNDIFVVNFWFKIIFCLAHIYLLAGQFGQKSESESARHYREATARHEYVPNTK